MGAKAAAKLPANRDESGRFRKGHSGNLSGRPKKDRELTAALERAVDKDVLARRVVNLAMAGDSTLLKYIYDRIEGTPTQRHEFSIDDYVHELREQYPDMTDEQGNVIARRAAGFWQRTG